MTKSKGRKPQKVVPKLKKKSNTQTKSKGSLGRTIVTNAGAALGSLVGLGELGRSAGNFIADVTGMGAYKLKHNEFTRDSGQVPQFDMDHDGNVIYTRSEYICDVISSSAVASQEFVINPADPRTFPWLSGIADSYEQYEFHGLLFAYKPTSGSAIASTNNALGTVVLATQYDMSKPPLTTKPELENYQFSVSGATCEHLIHPVECAPDQDTLRARYLGNSFRTQALSSILVPLDSNLENNLNDLGRFQIASIGQQSNGITIGQLWVTYKVKLLKPRLISRGCSTGYYHVCSGPISTNACASGSPPFQVVRTLRDSTHQMDGLGISGNNTLTFGNLPFGTRVIVAMRILSAGNVTVPTWTPNLLTLNAAWFLDPLGVGSGQLTHGASTTSAMRESCYVINNTDPAANPSLVFGNVVTGGAVNFDYDLTVTIIPTSQYTGNGYLALPPTEFLESRIRNLEALVRLLNSETEQKQSTVVSIPPSLPPPPPPTPTLPVGSNLQDDYVSVPRSIFSGSRSNNAI